MAGYTIASIPMRDYYDIVNNDLIDAASFSSALAGSNESHEAERATRPDFRPRSSTLITRLSLTDDKKDD